MTAPTGHRADSAMPTPEGGLVVSPAERDALATVYALARAFDLGKPGGALESWARRKSGGNLDALAKIIAAVAAGRPHDAATQIDALRFDDPAATAQASAAARRLATQTQTARRTPP